MTESRKYYYIAILSVVIILLVSLSVYMYTGFGVNVGGNNGLSLIVEQKCDTSQVEQVVVEEAPRNESETKFPTSTTKMRHLQQKIFTKENGNCDEESIIAFFNWRTGKDRNVELYPDPDELDYIMTRVHCRLPTAFPRYFDGEFHIIVGHNINNKRDSWSYDANYDQALTASLRATLEHTEAGYFYGLGCYDVTREVHPTWANEHALKKLPGLQDHPKQIHRYLSTTALFNNINYFYWKNVIIPEYIIKRDEVVFMLNDAVDQNRVRKSFPRAKEFVFMEAKGLLMYRDENKRNNFLTMVRELAKKYDDHLFIIPYGPLSPIIIHEMWTVNPNNAYLDVGSAFDEFVKFRVTSDYQKPEMYETHFSDRYLCTRYHPFKNERMDFE